MRTKAVFKTDWGYKAIRTSGRPQSLHKLIAEAVIGRQLERHETVHHIDENKLNNDPRNLAVLTKGDHTRWHSYQRGERQKNFHVAHVGQKLIELLQRIDDRPTAARMLKSLPPHLRVAMVMAEYIPTKKTPLIDKTADFSRRAQEQAMAERECVSVAAE